RDLRTTQDHPGTSLRTDQAGARFQAVSPTWRPRRPRRVDAHLHGPQPPEAVSGDGMSVPRPVTKREGRLMLASIAPDLVPNRPPSNCLPPGTGTGS